jgi:hypothetical protein
VANPVDTAVGLHGDAVQFTVDLASGEKQAAGALGGTASGIVAAPLGGPTVSRLGRSFANRTAKAEGISPATVLEGDGIEPEVRFNDIDGEFRGDQIKHPVAEPVVRFPTPVPAVQPGPACFGSAMCLNYRETFFAQNPGLRGEVVIHHVVEQQTLDRYSGVVNPGEIHSLENLRGMPKGINSDVHLSQIRREWKKFYRANPNPSKADLLQKATEIDDKFGVQFDPAVR